MTLVWCLIGALLWRTCSADMNPYGNEAFDYIVVGCGISGLVVSARLSEVSNVTVLCLEAGEFDRGEDMITIPYYSGRQPHAFYKWEVKTTPQMQLDGATRVIPLGRGVGGGSLVNGMVWSRGNQQTFNSWANLGNDGWAWEDLIPYFRKAEDFDSSKYPPLDIASIRPDISVHGAFGPVHVSYPDYFWPQSNNWFEALKAVGISVSPDPNDGLPVGGCFLPLNIEPKSQRRHDARRAYYDPIFNRTNLIVRSQSQVFKVLFDQSKSNLRAAAVQYGLDGNSSAFSTVYARKEVILAAGAIHTPQILELSGIGPKQLLERYNLTVLNDLPGVGNNLQDHAMIHLNYPYTKPGLISARSLDTNSSLNQDCANEYYTSRRGPWTAIPLQAVAFPSLPQFVTATEQFLEAFNANSTAYLLLEYDSTLKAGYARQMHDVLDALRSAGMPAVEILNNNAGGLDLALQLPLSRGFSHINDTDPSRPPLVNPNWLSHPLDFQIMIEAMNLNQRLVQTPALQALQPTYGDVPANATIQQMENILRSRVSTEYHQCGTAAMLPLELGGVVDPSLLVYRTENLRVVDASIFPMIPAAHLQAVVYAVAEKAADIIKGIEPGPARK